MNEMKNLVNEIDVGSAIKFLRAGEIVALPTETVYGLAGDAANDLAVVKIFAAKKRPEFNPLIIHMASLEQSERIGYFSSKAKEFAEKYWPGPLTIVVPKREKEFAMLATAGLDTVAIRVPAHPVMQEILAGGLMLAAPSANISGRLTPTEAKHVAADFPDIYIVDGGKCEIGLESTVVTFDENDEVVLLRPGVLQIPNTQHPTPNTEKIISPGQMLKHYAPRSPIRINAQRPEGDEVFIGFGNVKCDFNLSRTRNLNEAAANLFSMLHLADLMGRKIAVAPVPANGIGAAINDRLVKASQI